MSDFWQVSENGKGFDSHLGANAKMHNRTISVLSYIKEYLLRNFHENPNESLGSYFYGFLHLNSSKYLSLNIKSNLFLNTYNKQNFMQTNSVNLNDLYKMYVCT